MKKALIGSGATSLALFATGTVLLWRVLRAYTVDVLERMTDSVTTLIRLLGSLRPGDSVVLRVEYPTYRLVKRWSA